MNAIQMTQLERIELALECSREHLKTAKRLRDDGMYEDFQAMHIADAVNHALNAIVLTFQKDALTDGDIEKLVQLVQEHTDVEIPEYIVESSDHISGWHESDLFARRQIDDDNRAGIEFLMNVLDDFIDDIDNMVHST